VRARGHVEDAILGEEGHNRVDVVGVERVEEGLEDRGADLRAGHGFVSSSGMRASRTGRQNATGLLLYELAAGKAGNVAYQAVATAIGLAAVLLGEADDAPRLVLFGGLLIVGTVALAGLGRSPRAPRSTRRPTIRSRAGLEPETDHPWWSPSPVAQSTTAGL
jgi:hypothetical protein